MSDHDSPVIFGEVFELLASDPTDQHIKWAKKLWKLSFQYDFSADDMHIDKALMKLDLAKDGGKDEWGYPVVIYRGSNGSSWVRP